MNKIINEKPVAKHEKRKYTQRELKIFTKNIDTAKK